MTGMKMFRVEYRDGRRVTFTAFSMKVAIDWAQEHGDISNWDAETLPDDARVQAPRWSDHEHVRCQESHSFASPLSSRTHCEECGDLMS